MNGPMVLAMVGAAGILVTALLLLADDRSAEWWAMHRRRQYLDALDRIDRRRRQALAQMEPWTVER